MTLFSICNVHYLNILHYRAIEIEANVATFICGQSGCGKSSLLKLLNATISPDSGTLLYRGQGIEEYDSILLRREVALLSQNTFLFDDSIRNNFRLFYEYRGQKMPDDTTITKFLNIASADFTLDANCGQLSGGERQRVFIALFLSFAPDVLLLDEPTSALDEVTADRLLHRLKDYCRQEEMTLIVASHDRVLAQRYADRLIDLDLEETHG